MFKKIYPSDFASLFFGKAKQVFPFELTTKEAIEKIGQGTVALEDDTRCYSWIKKGKVTHLIYVTVKKKQLIVHQMIEMISNSETDGYHNILLYLAKSFRLEEILIQTNTRFLLIDDNLSYNEYTYLEGCGYLFKITYHTGLVLGGGGAKGAYQIGVWHALEELNIRYNMISGTSVGALNGSLILQGDLNVAENMWQTISTDKILAVPGQEISGSYSVEQLIKNWQVLTKSAISSGGVSTKPLFELIKEMMIPEIIFSKEIDFYLVATATPSMEEKVVSLKEMNEESLPLWLLASSSFYPAMAPCLIDGVYYVDGGYRNNIPKDVLVNQGATDLIVVDVSGPGLSKSFKVPTEVVEVNLRSPWKLGSMLLFDGNRSTWNMILGYLETMKLYQKFAGNDYTFERNNFDQAIFKLSRDFFKFLKTVPKFEEWFEKKTTLKVWDWLAKNNYRPETFSLILLESIAKTLKVPPIEVYQLEEFMEILINKWHEEENQGDGLSENMLKSISEWLSGYLKEKAPITDYQVIEFYYNYYSQESSKGKDIYPLLMEVSWLTSLEALFLLFLEKRKL